MSVCNLQLESSCCVGYQLACSGSFQRLSTAAFCVSQPSQWSTGPACASSFKVHSSALSSLNLNPKASWSRQGVD